MDVEKNDDPFCPLPDHLLRLHGIIIIKKKHNLNQSPVFLLECSMFFFVSSTVSNDRER